MNKLLILLLFFPFCVSCQIRKAQKSGAFHPTVENSPMGCHIEGKIIHIFSPNKNEKGSICSKYPCRARVVIKEVNSCGSGVSLPLNAGDTITIRFTYSLHATTPLFPRMKVQFPGLKKGNSFFANAEQRLAMGSEGEFVVTSYYRK